MIYYFLAIITIAVLFIFYYFKKQNNFVVIARNVTRNYVELQNNYSHLFCDNRSMILFAGILNANVYILETGEIAPNQIIELSYVLDDSENPLLDFIIEFEAVLLSTDTPKINFSEVQSACRSQSRAIGKVIQKELNTFKGNYGVSTLVASGFVLPVYSSVRKNLDIKDI